MGLMPYYDDIGFVATCAFSEKLLSPVIPYEKREPLRQPYWRDEDTCDRWEGPLNTSLPLPEPEVAISIFHDGWDFKESPLVNSEHKSLWRQVLQSHLQIRKVEPCLQAGILASRILLKLIQSDTKYRAAPGFIECMRPS